MADTTVTDPTMTDKMWEPDIAAPNIGGLDNDRKTTMNLTWVDLMKVAGAYWIPYRILTSNLH